MRLSEVAVSTACCCCHAETSWMPSEWRIWIGYASRCTRVFSATGRRRLQRGEGPGWLGRCLALIAQRACKAQRGQYPAFICRAFIDVQRVVIEASVFMRRHKASLRRCDIGEISALRAAGAAPITRKRANASTQKMHKIKNSKRWMHLRVSARGQRHRLRSARAGTSQGRRPFYEHRAKGQRMPKRRSADEVALSLGIPR